MRQILFLSILCAAYGWADETADRTAIEKAVSRLNLTPRDPNLFTADFDGLPALARLAPGEPGPVVISHEPWREATIGPGVPPTLHFAIRTIRFITPDVALVDGANEQAPLSFVMKRQAADWRFAALRLIAP